MTIAVSLKVHDGVVLAADSASTLVSRQDGGGTPVINIYDNANKVFNLQKGLPIGAVTWGAGSIGESSIATLAKDFRDLTADSMKYYIDPRDYTIEGVALNFVDFIYHQNYISKFEDWTEKPALGFMVVGYSSGATLAEEWRIDIDKGECSGPTLMRKQQEGGMTWNGQPEAITRLVTGFSTKLAPVLLESGLDLEQVNGIIDLCLQRLPVSFAMLPMPIQDAIDLTHFLVDTTIKFSKFSPGPPTVGGPIEIAAITKYEGFKWIYRKHYYHTELNPSED